MISPSYSLRVRIQLPGGGALTAIENAVAGQGAKISDLVFEDFEAGRDGDLRQVAVCADCASEGNQAEVIEALKAIAGARIEEASDVVFGLHEGGKLSASPRYPLEDMRTLAQVYSPGVARVCTAIAEDPGLAGRYTIAKNTVAVVSDGTAVLGLGNIGARAAMPVMEGKAVLFKRFAGVDAWPVVLDTTEVEKIIRIVKAIAPAYGGINLEDISAPRCFEIERRLRAELEIPVFHDDQHGTAVVVIAALMSALRVVGKEIGAVRVVVNGIGAAGSAIIRLLRVAGAADIIAVDREGILTEETVASASPSNYVWRGIAATTNPRGITGDLRSALAGADVFIGVSAGGILSGADIATMNDDAVVFALANPVPEVDPIEAGKYAAVVATGRSDRPNQINNVLVFPGLFRGLLDGGAKEITDEMLLAAARGVAAVVGDEARRDYVIPQAFDPRVAQAVADAVRASVER